MAWSHLPDPESLSASSSMLRRGFQSAYPLRRSPAAPFAGPEAPAGAVICDGPMRRSRPSRGEGRGAPGRRLPVIPDLVTSPATSTNRAGRLSPDHGQPSMTPNAPRRAIKDRGSALAGRPSPLSFRVAIGMSMYDATAHHVDTLDGDRGPPVFYTDEGPDHMTEDRAAAEIERITTEPRARSSFVGWISPPGRLTRPGSAARSRP